MDCIIADPVGKLTEEVVDTVWLNFIVTGSIQPKEVTIGIIWFSDEMDSKVEFLHSLPITP